MQGRHREIIVRGQQRQIVPDAQLRDDAVDGSDLQTGAPRGIAQFGGLDVILSVGKQEW